MAAPKPLNIHEMKEMKAKGLPISMITAYDYPSARLAEEAGVDLILVGDSLGNVIINYDSTLPVTMDDIVYHTRAVTRATEHTFIVADMPFMTYHGSIDETLKNVRRIMQEGFAHSVKLEGGAEIGDTVRRIVEAGVPVMGHIGLTPQSIHQIGGYKIQGKDSQGAKRLLDDAKALEQAGAFAVLVEMVTEEAADAIARELSVPVIGIGAGRTCDGQVLVYHDLLGYSSPKKEKRFVKEYADLGTQIRSSIAQYVKEVRERSFPGEEHVFHAKDDVLEQLYGGGKAKTVVG
ncbi:3-methyl-2-oxobutanoate hydroxymethyltransferase [Cohnella sp. AR92]|uniref:3-methyl-2-oxobutanoate hydroxymethyltransferase n=1 Tax=Cohnella sp. AR92 TaxID=648716 RepID=UPI000F8D02FF|nr:3-methyl-2-oxobutanoate hydroxymethyltransferase [Cohnella sp. AR92]RUS45110.1 3-methyl-2-oxobutanoate hydroxymethyltransferase [Cohnella sp. AR92]